AAWVASVLLFRLAMRWRGLQIARLATAGLFAFPFAFFLTTVFPHALFLALSLASLQAADRGQFVAAGMWSALATATRADGIVLGPAIVVGSCIRHGFVPNRQAIGIVLAPLGMVAYVLYLWWQFDRPLAFMAIQEQFGRAPTNPMWTFVR